MRESCRRTWDAGTRLEMVMQNFLTLASIHAGYGDVPVLWGVDISLERGDIACLVGSNGAGKTTLLRAISGLIPTTTGNVEFDGLDLTGASPESVLAAGIAHVPEGRRLFPGMSVR